MGFDRRHQDVLVTGPLIVDLVGDDDLFLRLLQFDHFAEFGWLAGLAFPNAFGGELEQADDLAFGMGVAGKDASLGLADHLLHQRDPCCPARDATLPARLVASLPPPA